MNSQIKALIFGNSLFILGGSMLVPVYALFSEKIGAGIELAGILFAIKFLANSGADIAILFLKDKMSFEVSAYRLSMFIRGLSWIYLGLFPSIGSLLLVQIVTGFAEGFGTTAFSTVFADNLDKGKHMREWAIWDLTKNPVIAIGSAVSGLLVAHGSFEMMFYIMGLLAIVASFVPISSKDKS